VGFDVMGWGWMIESCKWIGEGLMGMDFGLSWGLSPHDEETQYTADSDHVCALTYFIS
jgi:hypothetical protein